MQTYQRKAYQLRSDDAGFTLPELLVTILIMGIIAVIAVPSWIRVVESRDIDSAANQVAADLRQAHSSSVNRLGTTRIIFNRADRTTPGGAQVACGSGSTPPMADYCLVEPGPTGTPRFTPRFLPDRARISSPNILVDPPAILGAALPPGVVGGSTSTVEFEAAGTAAARSAVVDPTIRISAPDDSPGHDLIINTQTSRIKVV